MVMNDRIDKHEIGLWFRDDVLQGVLPPGRHRHFVPFFAGDRVEVFDRSCGRFEHPQFAQIVSHPALAAWLRVVDVPHGERIHVRQHGTLRWVLGPGRHAFWNRQAALCVESLLAEKGLRKPCTRPVPN